MKQTISFNLIQILFVLIFAPLYSGVLSRLKEIVQSKRGPSIFQPYRDLWKLFHKDEVVSSESTWIFRVTPYLVFVTPVFVTVLIPVLTDYPLAFAFMGDMLAGDFSSVSEGSLPRWRLSTREILTARWEPAGRAWSASWRNQYS